MVIYCYLIHWFTPTDRRPPNHRLNSANKMHQSGNHFNYSLIRFDFNVNFMLTERIRLSAFVYQTVLFIGYSLSLEPTRECWNDQQMVKHKQFQWIIDCELCCVALRVWIGMSIHISESLLKNCWWNRIEQKEKISHQTHWNCMNMKYTGNSKAIDRWSTLHSQFQTKDLSIGFSIHFFCTIQNYAKLFKQMTKKNKKHHQIYFCLRECSYFVLQFICDLIFVRCGQNKKQRTMKSKKKNMKNTYSSVRRAVHKLK